MTEHIKSTYEQNKSKLQEIINQVQKFVDDSWEEGKEKIETAKSWLMKARYNGLTTYHELMSDAYTKSEAWQSDIKALEHTLKSLSTKAKSAWLDISMDIKEFINED